MPDKYINIHTLKVSESLLNFVNEELLTDTGVSTDQFWLGFEKTVNELEPKNRELINIRETLQKKINDWHIKNKGNEIKLDEYKKFLYEIGYLKEEGTDFSIETENVDDEITKIAGPQLVVPIMNARYALNAANARWMSLYDSLYGTDIKEIDCFTCLGDLLIYQAVFDLSERCAFLKQYILFSIFFSSCGRASDFFFTFSLVFLRSA